MTSRASQASVRRVVSVVALVLGVAAAMVFGTGAAGAAVDNTSSLVTPSGLRIEVQLSDTSFQFVPPLDRNPLSREWFHDGLAGYAVSGPGAETFTGVFTLGYQVGYPFSPTGTLSTNYTTPGGDTDQNLPGIQFKNLLPTAGYSFSVGYGPGIQTVDVAAAEVAGPAGTIAIQGVHGSISGVMGMISIRPFLTVTTPRGDSVTTYGKIWDH
ncbi:MspA family porin [Aldersonia sp. NBC_00410]|uniref:MspA family porin n=1 Tax=Aldersonia sp. NBC_00410 TaxID=2975954 RepID=UPI00224D300D|nr:MspA family porin [Aldersonia sp. NBC_00410]MCX5043774.1 MspA family porin [Aldersonia sp. NBC_00410]